MSDSDQPSSSSLIQPEPTGSGKIIAQLPSGIYAAAPLLFCPHLCSIGPIPEAGIDTSQSCNECQDISENWVCLTCYRVLCSRYVNGHGLSHFNDASHAMALSFSDLSAWCYVCNAYVHNDAISPARNAAYVSKFGESPPVIEFNQD